MGLGIKTSIALEKAKILVKQIKTLGFSQAGLPPELDVSMIVKGMRWALWQKLQKERISLGLESQRGSLGFWEGTETQYIPTEQQLLAVYVALSERNNISW